MMDDYFNDYLNFRMETDMTNNNGQMDEKGIEAYYQDYLKRYPWAKGTRSNPAEPTPTPTETTKKWEYSGPDVEPNPRNAFVPEGSIDPDMVNSPDHYTEGSMEAINVMEAKLTQEQYQGYLQGSVMKYLLRSNYKGKRDEDLKKAQWYLNKLVENQS
jgi:hypothetical protein